MQLEQILQINRLGTNPLRHANPHPTSLHYNRSDRSAERQI